MAVNSFNAQNPPVTTKGDLFTFSTIPTRLGVGANNTVLTADSSTATGLKWAAVDASSMTSLASGSLSGSNLDLQSISGSYRNLYLVLNQYRVSTNTGALTVRFNNDAGANRYNVTFDASLTGYANFGATGMDMTSGTSNTATTQSIFLTFREYAVSGIWKTCEGLNQNTSTAGSNNNHILQRGLGIWNQTSVIDRITVIPAGGWVSQGTYALYGVK